MHKINELHFHSLIVLLKLALELNVSLPNLQDSTFVIYCMGGTKYRYSGHPRIQE